MKTPLREEHSPLLSLPSGSWKTTSLLIFPVIPGIAFASPGEYLPCSAAPGILAFSYLLFDFKFFHSEEPPRTCFDPVGQWTLKLGPKIRNWSQPFQAAVSGADHIYSPIPIRGPQGDALGCLGCGGWEQKTPPPLQVQLRKLWHST